MTGVPFVEHKLRRDGKDFRVRVLETHTTDGEPACAAIYGELTDDCLVRIHTRCVYGEVFQSEDCDCSVQLKTSLQMITDAGSGIVIYLDQEGRGAGLLAKASGYRYGQEHGIDTFASYRALDLPEDSRTFGDAVELVKGLGLSRVRLLTNNPEKVRALEEKGILVKVEPWRYAVSASALAYLDAKRRRGHTIPAFEAATD